MHRFLAACLLFVLASATSARMAAEWSNWTQANDFPGIAFVATEGDAVTELKTSGVKTLESDDPITAATPFLVGSISKSFTALAIMQLVEAGEVELNAPLSRYLSDFEGKPAGEITIHRLLNHTSGFSTAQGNTTQTDFAEDANALTRRVDRLIETVPDNEQGSLHQYSNANYQLLGRVIEVVSDMTYSDYIERNVLAPAGMEDSFVHPSPRSDELAQGHRPWFGGFRVLDRNMTGAGSAPQGGIAASARDMARYMALMINGEDDILSAEGKALMMRSEDNAAPEYGYGWNIDRDTGRIWHAGSNAGYDALAAMLPAERKSAAVLLNAGSGLAFGRTGDLRLGLTSAALGLEPPEAADPTPFKAIFFALGLLPPLFLFGIYRAWKNRHRPQKRGW